MAQTTIDVSKLPTSATVGVPYSGDVVVNYVGANPAKFPFTYSIGSGTPPPGLAALPASAGTGNCAANSACTPFTWTGTPTQAGTYTFTISVVDGKSPATPLGTSASVTITVAAAAGGGGGGGAAAPTATVAVASVSGVAGTALAAVTPVTGSGGTGTLTYSVSPALGNGLSFNTATGQITGTPTAAAAATSYTVTVTDTASKTATGTFSLNITAPVVAGPTATTAVALVSGQAGKALTAVTPVTGSGGTGTLTYSISPAIGNGLSFSTSTGQVSGTPTAAAAAVSYTVTVTDTASKTASATFSLVVSAAPVVRPDPSKDAGVTGLLTGQAHMTQQFARTQLASVSSRLQQLRGECNCTGSNVWAGGATQNGSLNGVSSVNSNSLTLGYDGEIRAGLVGGVAVGLADDGAKVDNSGTRVDGKGYSFSAYGTYSLPAVTIDADLSFGSSSLNTSRWVAVDSALVSGKRNAYTTFGSLALSRRYSVAGFTVEPQLGAEYINSVLGRYSETNQSKSTTGSLSYNGQGVRSLSWLAGVRAEYDVKLAGGLLRPVIKAEYRQINDHSQAQTLFYSDTPGTLYTVSGNGLPGNLLTGEAGVQFGSRSGLFSQLLIGYSSGGNGLSNTSFKATVNKTLGAN